MEDFTVVNICASNLVFINFTSMLHLILIHCIGNGSSGGKWAKSDFLFMRCSNAYIKMQFIKVN